MTQDADLLPHRQAIDALDAQILRCLNERARHAHAIGELKKNTVIYRPEREAQVLENLCRQNEGPLPHAAVVRLFREIMSECRALERATCVCYLGPEGTFTHLATLKQFGQSVDAQACATLDESFRRVEAHQADYVVAPVENSTEGCVARSLDLLLKTPLIACAEVFLRIHHHLLVKEGETLQSIRKVYAHPQALAQCQQWLNQNLPEAERCPVSSNAQGAQHALNEKGASAIASQEAALRYGLQPLFSSIEDEINNTTRFLVLGHQNAAPSGCDKTSLIVSVPNRVGSIYELLKPFADFGVSMSKLESRPARNGLWEYAFFIDIEGHVQDEKVAQSLKVLREKASFMKIIGSYPQALPEQH